MYEKVPLQDSEDPPQQPEHLPQLTPWKRSPSHQFLDRICNMMVVVLGVCMVALLVVVVMNFAGILQIETWNVRSELQLLQTRTPFDKPVIDRNQYRFLHLGALKVLLIRDVDATVGEAALCVQVGSWMDPKEHQGLAHFLEHMLFQGSHKYPKPGHFQRLVSKSGWSNAYTRVDETNYFFKVQESQMKEVLDVFAHFFVDPLFDSAMVDKEMNAVNSEYQIGLTSDGWKMVHLLNQLSKSTHPMNKFSTGNLDTLANSLPDLLAFHEKYYSANLMSLVIRSSLDLDEYVRNSDFKEITNSNAPRPHYAKFGYPIPRTGILAKYRIDGSSRKIQYIYQLASPFKHWETQPLRFISAMLTRKHSEGLYQHLRDKKYILTLDADTMFEQNGFTFFMIEMTQPKEQPLDSVYEIGQIMVGYFNNMLEAFFEEVDEQHIGESQRLADLWQQEKKVERLKFNYFLSQVPVQNFARNLNKFPAAKVLAADTQYESLNPETIYDYLVELANPINMLILIGDNEFKKLEQRSDLYNLDFEVEDISDTNLHNMGRPLTSKNIEVKGESDTITLDLQLPPLNPYVPTHLTMISLCHSFQVLAFVSKRDCLKHEEQFEQKNSYPTMIEKSPYQLWWKVQRSYQTPLVFMGLKLDRFVPQSRDQAMGRIMGAYWQEKIETEMYQFEEAGVQFTFDTSMHGVILNLLGWSDGFDRIFTDIYSKMKEDLDDENTYQLVIQQLKERELNRYQERLFLQGLNTYLPGLLLSDKPSPEKLIEEFDQLTLDQVNEYRKTFLQGSQAIAMISGNIAREDAQSLLSGVFSRPQSIHRYTVLNFMGQFVKMAIKSRDQLNSATIHVYQLGKRTQETYNLMSLVGGSLGNKVFERLRTQQQLGYVAKARFRPYGCVDTLLIFVQGVYEPQLYTTRIDEYAVELIEEFKSLTDEQLDELKNGAVPLQSQKICKISQLKSKPKSLRDEASGFWGPLSVDYHHLDERALAIEQIPHITKEDVEHFISGIFGGGRMVLHLFGHQQYETNWVAGDPDTVYSHKDLKARITDRFECSHGLTSTV